MPAASINQRAGPVLSEEGGRLVATFRSEDDAVAWLESKGFSVGRLQAGAPRGLLFGNFDISKWRNLSAVDRAELHGLLIGGRSALRVTASLNRGAPAEAREAFRAGRPS